MKKYNFSIVVPFFNNNDDIPNLYLTLSDYFYKSDCEIIIVDDCSTIFCYNNLLNTFSKNIPNLKIIRNESNQGAAYSRERGVFLAKGDYILFLDADDAWVKNRAYILYNFCKQKDIDICGGRCKEIQKESLHAEKDVDWKPTIKRISFYNFLFKNYFSTPAVIVKRQKIIDNKFDVTMRYSEDFECWRRIILNSTNSFVLTNSGAFMFKHPYMSGKGLSSSTYKMSMGEIYGLLKLFKNKQVGVLKKIIIPIALLFSMIKAIIRILKNFLK